MLQLVTIRGLMKAWWLDGTGERDQIMMVSWCDDFHSWIENNTAQLMVRVRSVLLCLPAMMRAVAISYRVCWQWCEQLRSSVRWHWRQRVCRWDGSWGCPWVGGEYDLATAQLGEVLQRWICHFCHCGETKQIWEVERGRQPIGVLVRFWTFGRLWGRKKMVKQQNWGQKGEGGESVWQCGPDQNFHAVSNPVSNGFPRPSVVGQIIRYPTIVRT